MRTGILKRAKDRVVGSWKAAKQANIDAEAVMKERYPGGYSDNSYHADEMSLIKRQQKKAKRKGATGYW